MSITVVITNYARPTNVRRLIDVLYRQTIKPTIFVWNNSLSEDFGNARVDWVVRSSRNARCSPRWWMASHADTDFVIIHDDDLLPSHPKVIAWTLDAATKTLPFAVGVAGVITSSHLGYWQSRHVGLRATRVERDARVDIVKGCYFCCPTSQLAEVGYLELDAEDDIAVSAKLGRGLEQPHLVLAEIQKHFELLPEGEYARKNRANHRAARDAARWRYFEG